MRFDDMIRRVYKKIAKEFKTAFIAALIVGLVAHIYMFTNKLPNLDDVGGINGFGSTFKTGRWFLWIIGATAYHLKWVFSLPWINGLFILTLLGISAGIVAIMLQLKSVTANVILGAAFVVFPSWTSTFFYMYIAPYFAVAVLMSVVSVYMTVSYKWGWAAAVPTLACSIGIYQAYIPFTATLYVVILFLMFYDNRCSYSHIIKKSLLYLFVLGMSLVLYFVCMKASLAITGQELRKYKGIDTMGKFSLSKIPKFFDIVLDNFFCIFLNNNLEISYNLVTKGMYFVLFIGSFVLIAVLAWQLICRKEYVKGAAVIVMAAVYVVAINSIYLMCDEGIYSLMYYSYVFLMIFPLVLIDRSSEILLGGGKLVFVLEYVFDFVLIVGVASYCHFANGQYLSINLSLNQAMSYYGTLITQIKSTEGYNDGLSVLLYGKNEDKSLYHNEIMDTFSMSGRDNSLVDSYDRPSFMKYYCGFDAQFVGTEMLPEESKIEIEKMPCYPYNGSIKILDDVVVVKFWDESD